MSLLSFTLFKSLLNSEEDSFVRSCEIVSELLNMLLLHQLSVLFKIQMNS